MQHGKLNFYVLLGLIAILISSCIGDKEIDFSTEIKPILNNNCIVCHGGVKKAGGFSLLFEEDALAKLESGEYGIVPGNAKSSAMIQRLKSDDPEERMPYEKDPLSKEDIKKLTKWINQGAKWGEHWAYAPLAKPKELKVRNSWIRNNIDKHIFSTAKKQGLRPSPEGRPEDLARRLSLDLIGYLNYSEEVNTYLQDPTDEHYEALVDQLLASPHFGEKWTSMWLDIARYADTKGYERDGGRSIWQYRDWVIKAFNNDMPYDQFIRDQVAGDLLDDPTEDQYIATAFHRNSMTNDEGGTDNEEFRVAAVLDRVNTTWEGLLSTSFSCVQCHSHPYDPFTHENYYQSVAYFNNTRDYDTYSDYPLLKTFDQQTNQEIDKFIEETSATLKPEESHQLEQFIRTWQPAIYSLECDSFLNSELSDTKWLAMRNHSSSRIPAVPLDGVKNLIFRYRGGPSGAFQLHLDHPAGSIIGRYKVGSDTKGWKIVDIPISETKGNHSIYITYSNARLGNTDQTGIQFDWFHFNDAAFKKLPIHLQDVFWTLVNKPSEVVPIMMENDQQRARKTHVFERGNWLSLGEEVAPRIPSSIQTSQTYHPSRMGLAEWMVDAENPLLSRTIVNRIWEQFFGRGIVETLEDMGTQGSLPTHPQLLDELSYDLMHKYDWSLKSLMKEIVMSSTYRQDSRLSPLADSKDPFNYYLARGPRVRLSAEQIRDQALAAAGVMNKIMYGAPVMPYQPEGIWVSPYSGDKWTNAQDSSQYRRAIYVYWKRTNPYPSFINFDAVGREVCTARRISTNTPLQALTTLNDPVYDDLAKQFASLVWSGDAKESIEKAYYRITYKSISGDRLDALLGLFNEAKSRYDGDDDSNLYAMSLVANALFNLDEVIMKN